MVYVRARFADSLSELLRSYRIAHGQAILIEPFERALKEHTPLTSIKDPSALVEYLNQLNLRSAMVMEELRRVTSENEDCKKKLDQQDKELASLRANSSGHASAGREHVAAEVPDEKQEPPATPRLDAVKPPVAGVLGMFSPKSKSRIWGSGENPPAPPKDHEGDSEEFFSYEYEQELPKLRADLVAKTEEAESLKAEIATLKANMTPPEGTDPELPNNPEQGEKELEPSENSAAKQVKLEALLEERVAEIAELQERLDQTQAQLDEAQKQLRDEQGAATERAKETQEQLAQTTLKAGDLDLQLQKTSLAKTGLEKKVDELLIQLEEERSDKQERIAKLAEQIKTASQAPKMAEVADSPAASSASPSATPSVAGGSAGGPKRKNRKKKKGGAAGAGAAATPPADGHVEGEPSPDGTPNVAALEEEIARLTEDVADKDRQIDRLSKKRKTEDDLREEVDNLRDDLISIGQDHVEAKQRVKDLETERRELQTRIAELEATLDSAPSESAASQELQQELEALRRDHGELKQNAKTLQMELGAAESLAQTRYKDLSALRDVLQKAQPEMQTLRQDSAALKTTKDELAARVAELKSLELEAKDLKSQLTRSQQLHKSVEEKLSTETSHKLRLEEAQRVAGRDLRRSEAGKIEISAREEKASREVQRLQEEATKLRPRVQELEVEVERLGRERKTAAEEATLKAQQYASVQGLLGSMREQTAELTLQLKEARDQAESLEEELSEVQRLLRERTHEGETMRRMLADVDARAGAKVDEMRARLEAAVEERDRLEDEASTRALRGRREAEDLRARVRDLERDVKALTAEKEALEESEREWQGRRDELESEYERSRLEVEDVRTSAAGLRRELDESELKARDSEQQRTDLRRVLDEQRARYDKLSRDFKALQPRLGSIASGGSGIGSSIRSSGESTRHGSVSNGGPPGADLVYIRTIMLQFLEQRDGRLRSQLVPVLGKLLGFEK